MVSWRVRYVQCHKRSHVIRSSYGERASPHPSGDRARAARQLRTGGRGAWASRSRASPADRLVERSLGVRLFDRTCKGVIPTAFGRVLLERGEAVLRSEANLRREIELWPDSRRGRSRSEPACPGEISVARGRRPCRQRSCRLGSVHDRRSESGRPGRSDRVLDVGIAGVAQLERDARLVVEPLPRRCVSWPAGPGPVGEGEPATSRAGVRVPFRGHEAARRSGGGRIHPGRCDSSGPSRGPGLHSADPRELVAVARPVARERRDLPGHGRDLRRRPGGRAPRHVHCDAPILADVHGVRQFRDDAASAAREFIETVRAVEA